MLTRNWDGEIAPTYTKQPRPDLKETQHGRIQHTRLSPIQDVKLLPEYFHWSILLPKVAPLMDPHFEACIRKSKRRKTRTVKTLRQLPPKIRSAQWNLRLTYRVGFTAPEPVYRERSSSPKHARPVIAQQAPLARVTGPQTSFMAAADVITGTRTRRLGGTGRLDVHGSTGGEVGHGSNGGDRGDGVLRGESEGVDRDGLTVHKWEPNVFSIVSRRPRADVSGFEYVSASEVSREGCGKQSCVGTPQAQGEIGACYCPQFKEVDVQMNYVCQCEDLLKRHYDGCRFSARDLEMFPPKKLLVLADGVVAGEDIPEGSLVTICKGRVSPGPHRQAQASFRKLLVNGKLCQSLQFNALNHGSRIREVTKCGVKVLM